jgi:hypothetical protein
MSNNVLFTDRDIKLIEENLPRLQEEAERLKNSYLKPSIDIQKKIIDVIVNYIITKKRKIYGGYAMNELLNMVDPSLCIYEKGSVNDVDFYSPDPINDVMDLCDILHKLDIGEVRAREALHGETYSIFVDDQNYCDASYVPNSIYHKMPFKQNRNGLYLIHPHFMWIDYLRMLTDPIGSWFRIEKSIKRFSILQKTFPFPKNMNSIETNKGTSEVETALRTIFDFIDNRDTTIQIGTYAYNYLLYESGATRQMSGGRRNKENRNTHRTTSEKLSYIDIPHYEMISVNYIEDAKELIGLLKKQFPDENDIIECVEHYPFFQYAGFHVNIYCKGDLVATIYDNHHKCYPSKVDKTRFFSKDSTKHFNTKGKVRIGTFSVILMYLLTNIQRARTEENESEKETYYSLASQVIHMRNYFLDTSGKGILDNTLFQEMSTDCIGKPISSFTEKRLRIEKNKKEGKRFSFNYDPRNTVKVRPKLQFANSSGRPINNEKNLLLSTCPIKDSKDTSDDKDTSDTKDSE